MKQLSAKTWLISWVIITILLLIYICTTAYIVDPFFHYHKPDTSRFFYELDWQRYQNDGICRHFDYNALITGTSMAENFMASEADELFNANSIKVCFSGGSYKEINDCIERALSYNSSLHIVIRSLDMDYFISSADKMRTDLGKYPTYLYDHNPLNDIKYLLSRDVFVRTQQMISDSYKNESDPGITSFDDYSNWMDSEIVFGRMAVLESNQNVVKEKYNSDAHLNIAERQLITENISTNVTSLADKYPNVDFYYFFPPYSIVWWNNKAMVGSLTKQLEAEKMAVELIVQHPNIHLYAFNCMPEIVADLNNYKDSTHYGPWINSYILRSMHDGNGLLTKENCQDYFEKEYTFFTSYEFD